MLKLATILQNPGEPPATTRYHDLSDLAAMGYNGLVLYETTALSGVVSPEEAPTTELEQWIVKQTDTARARIEQARAAHLQVYVSYDAMTLSRRWVEENPGAVLCRNRFQHVCPASGPGLERSAQALRALLSHVGEADGVVLRFGDTDAARLEYLVGNDVYTPRCGRCAEMTPADRVVTLLNHYHDLVVGQLGLRLIARAWNVCPNGLHDSVKLCRQIADRLPGAPGDDRFVLSFKFTHTDFWRYQAWNPASLALQNRLVIYELQCQREFEAKGAVPNWQVPLWQGHAQEQTPTGGVDDPDSPETDFNGGLAEASKQIDWAGVMVWVRGGGWGGPFIKNETWIDANVYAAPLLADQPDADPADLAQQWISQRLGLHDRIVAVAVGRVLKNSAEVILKGFYIGPHAVTSRDPWLRSAGLIQDDLIDAQAAWQVVRKLPDSQLDQVIQEKKEAVNLVAADRASLQSLITDELRAQLEPMVSSLMYAEGILTTLRSLLEGLVAYRRYLQHRDPATAKLCYERLLSAQSHWNHHTQRHGSLPGAATVFREIGFWDLTQQILTELS